MHAASGERAARFGRLKVARRILACALPALLANACMIGPDHAPPEVDVPTHWATAESPLAVAGEPEQPMLWWQTFDDPVLSGLVEEALAQNLDVKAAGLRVVQARSSKTRAKELLVPVVTTGGGYLRRYTSENVKPDIEVNTDSVVLAAPPIPQLLDNFVVIGETPDVHLSRH